MSADRDKLPLRGRIVHETERWLLSPLPMVVPARAPQPDDYLLYPVRAVGRGASVRYGYPKKRPSPQVVHRWWYARLEAAGIVEEGVTAGMNMHRARHSFGRAMRRTAGIEAASQALGHADLNTTLGIYGHQDETDLERAFEALARERRDF